MPNKNDDAGALCPVIAVEALAGRGIESENEMPGDSGSDNDDERLAIVMSATEDSWNGPTDDEGDEKNVANYDRDEESDGIAVAVDDGHSQQSIKHQTSLRNQKQDEFVKNGARVKALISTVLRAVADGIIPINATATVDSRIESDENEDNESRAASKRTRYTSEEYDHVRTVAQERSEECLSLKMKLEGLQSQIDFFQNEISISHQMSSQLKDKSDRTLEALIHAGANAANARAEANASNARAESLLSQLNELQSVIEETRRGMELVRREHDEVSRITRTVEGRLIQVESELVRATRTKNDALKDRDILQAQAENAEKIAGELQDKVDDYQNEVRLLKKDLIERDEMEQIRTQRTRSIETEVEVARSSLLEATSAAVEAEATVASLRSVIVVLERENKTLHSRMNESRDSFAKDRSKLNEALLLAEREAQKWKLKCEDVDEEIRKLTMDKTSAEKQVEQLKSRLENRRLNNDTSEQCSRSNTTSPALQAVTHHVSNNLGFINSFGANDISVVTEESKKQTHITELPMRDSVNAQLSSSSRQLTYAYQKGDHDFTPHQSTRKRPGEKINICCLCSQEGGMILKCQCDNINCDKRAHAICIGKFRSSEKDNSSRTILCKNNRCG